MREHPVHYLILASTNSAYGGNTELLLIVMGRSVTPLPLWCVEAGNGSDGAFL